MKNIIIALVVVTAAGAGGGYYYYSQQQGSGAAVVNNGVQQKNPMLQWVPADSLFFMGGLEPFPTSKTLQAMTFMGDKSMVNPEMNKLFEPVPTDPAGANLFKALMKDYMENLNDLAAYMKSFGLPDEGNSVFYTVSGIPVLRVQLGKVDTFKAKMGQLEASAGIKGEEQQLGELKYTAYQLIPKDKQENIKAKLVYAISGNDVIFSFSVNEDRGKILPVAFGMEKPKNSLADSTVLTQLMNDFGLHPGFLGYVNHQEIVHGLTSKEEDTQVSRLLSIVDHDKKMTQGLESIRTEGCRSDLGRIAANWPRLVFGYTALDMDNNPVKVNSVMVLESKDGNYLKALKDLRGFIPAHALQVSKENILALAVGLDVDSIVPFLNQEISDISQKQYQCEVLVGMQNDIKKQNAAALGMMTAMVQGLQGVSITLNKIEIDQEKKAPNVIDLIVTITSKNPSGLMNMIAQLGLKNPQFKVPADGSPVDLPIPMPIPNFSPKVAIKGSHIVAYNGALGEVMADKIAGQRMEPNGMLAMNINYQKYFDLLNLAPLPPQARKEFEVFSKQDMQVSIRFDVDSKGISIYSDMLVTRAANQAAAQ